MTCLVIFLENITKKVRCVKNPYSLAGTLLLQTFGANPFQLIPS
jgi:hypothetical protein